MFLKFEEFHGPGLGVNGVEWWSRRPVSTPSPERLITTPLK
ncbi:hypothetical protein [Parasynechococcus sp.]